MFGKKKVSGIEFKDEFKQIVHAQDIELVHSYHPIHELVTSCYEPCLGPKYTLIAHKITAHRQGIKRCSGYWPYLRTWWKKPSDYNEMTV